MTIKKVTDAELKHLEQLEALSPYFVIPSWQKGIDAPAWNSLFRRDRYGDVVSTRIDGGTAAALADLMARFPNMKQAEAARLLMVIGADALAAVKHDAPVVINDATLKADGKEDAARLASMVCPLVSNAVSVIAKNV
jgi:hypothetical protein